jgi:hypothetical protein
MQTTLFIGGVNVDLFEDEPILVNFSLTDVKEPASRNVSHTKTITLPNTPNNANIFRQLFVINKDNTISGYDPNIRVVAFVENGSGNCISGYFQLTGITKNGTDIKYNGVIYSDEKNLFSQMGDSFIQGNPNSANDVDLDTGTSALSYSPYNYTKAFTNGFVASGSAGELFTIDTGTNTTQTNAPYYNIPYTNLRMAVKFKHIWDRIFAKYNTTYSSTFLNTTRFKSMVYLDTHKNANLSIGQYNDLYAAVNRSTNTAYLASSGANVRVVYNAEQQDTSNRYNTGTGLYLCNSTRNHTVVTNSNVRARIKLNDPTVIYAVDTTIQVQINAYVARNLTLEPTTNGVFQNIVVPAGTYMLGQTFEYNLSDPFAVALPFERTVSCTTGDNLEVVLQAVINTGGAVTVWDAEVSVLTGSTSIFKPESNQLAIYDLYSKNSVPASQHKQKDFIVDILRMFNLYLLWDGVNYIIEPRDNFYTLGTQYDWTQKIDRSQEMTITPIGQLNWRQIQMLGKQDADYYSEQYVINNKEVYGQQNVFNQNQFITDIKKVELTFAPPMTVSTAANYPKLQHIYKLNNGVAEAIDGKPRYGYWAGWKEEGQVFSQITGAGALIPFDGYAYVGEFDDPINSTFSVLFGPPRAVYYRTFGVLAITDNDLYSEYYQNELMNQVSANAKLITCYVYLTALEINNLKLYDTVVVDGVKCIISKISDYNTTTVQPTQVELIQFIQ